MYVDGNNVNIAVPCPFVLESIPTSKCKLHALCRSDSRHPTHSSCKTSCLQRSIILGYWFRVKVSLGN